MNSDKHITLSVFHEIRAAHTLEANPLVHFHVWKLSADFRMPFPLKSDRVIDLVFLQNRFEEMLRPLQGSVLNESLGVSPTSENFCVWLWKQWESGVPDAPLFRVSISLCDSEGRATGMASLGR